MADDWSRRALLATLGATALAGCTSTDAPDTSTGSESTSSPAETSPTPTESSTTTDTETSTETATPRPDPEPPASIDSAWPMPDGDPGRSRGRTAAKGPVDPIGELWAVTADATLSDPVVVDETLFVGADDGSVRALDARTGTEGWQTGVGAPASTPWILDGTLYVPTADEVVALDAGSGRIQWRTATPSRAGFALAPHGVYWLADGESAVVVGLRRSDGSERWRTDVERCSRAAPYVFAGSSAVYVSTGPYASVPTTLDDETGRLREEPTGCGADFAGERFHRDGRIVATDSFFGRVESTPVDDGEGWDADVSPGKHLLCGGPDRVYVDVVSRQEAGLYALNADDGSTAWHDDAGWTSRSRPVVAGETLLVNTEEALRCFDPTDGTVRWTMPSDDVGDRIIVADDLVYTTTGETVRAFRSA